ETKEYLIHIGEGHSVTYWDGLSFHNGFNSYFLESEHKVKAQQALRTFKQSGNMDSYTQKFNVHTYNSAWSNNILVSLYCGRLKEKIRVAIFQPQPHFQNQPTNPLHYRNRPKCNGPLGNERQLASWSYILRLPKEDKPRPIYPSALLTYRC
ncbi:uncharacterized protein VP01_7624g1, partial [Puccinia sorghi]